MQHDRDRGDARDPEKYGDDHDRDHEFLSDSGLPSSATDRASSPAIHSSAWISNRTSEL